MKKIALIFSIAVILCSCKKEQNIFITPVIGHQYNVKNDNLVFNKGAFRPTDPVLVLSLYINPQGVPYAHCTAPIDWSSFSLIASNGVAELTVEGNALTLRQLNLEGIQFGDTTIMPWEIPQDDLAQVN
jgi:hypothetical protein